jgi:histidinol-phosphate aminotransferase
MNDIVNGTIRAEIRALAAYHVQDAAGFIKLDAMENPFDFPAHLREGLAARLADASLNRYPDASGDALKAALRRAMQIPAECDILLGNGSDEIIQMIAMAVGKPGATILSVEPAFVMFKMIATYCGLNYAGVPLRSDFSIDRAAMLSAIEQHQPAVTFIAYPNNPTGNLFARDDIEAIINASSGIVVIDEAYFAFSSQTYLHDVIKHRNVVLMRTVSKLGLAGLRLGMLIGRAEWLGEFDKVRLPYNINVLTQAAAMFALENIDAFNAQAAQLVGERVKLDAALRALFTNRAGFDVFTSEANFILVRVANSVETFAKLRERKILVKHTGSSADPLLSNTLRLTVGAPNENQALIAALTEIL